MRSAIPMISSWMGDGKPDPGETRPYRNDLLLAAGRLVPVEKICGGSVCARGTAPARGQRDPSLTFAQKLGDGLKKLFGVAGFIDDHIYRR